MYHLASTCSGIQGTFLGKLYSRVFSSLISQQKESTTHVYSQTQQVATSGSKIISDVEKRPVSKLPDLPTSFCHRIIN